LAGTEVEDVVRSFPGRIEEIFFPVAVMEVELVRYFVGQQENVVWSLAGMDVVRSFAGKVEEVF